MADTNTYISKQKVEKWTSRDKFNALNLSDIPVGTEYNLTGAIEESDLDSDLQTKINKIETKTLYRHDLRITRTAPSSAPGFGYSVYCSFYSSSNLNISSLTNLRTVVGNQFTLMATGYLSGTGANYDPVEAIFQSGVRPIRNTDQTYDNATFSDTVTKII